MVVAQVRVSLEYLTTRNSAGTRSGHGVLTIIHLMVLAGDVGGTKTLLGLFEPSARRPTPVATRSYETTAYSSFLEILDAFLRDVPPSARLALSSRPPTS